MFGNAEDIRRDTVMTSVKCKYLENVLTEFNEIWACIVLHLIDNIPISDYLSMSLIDAFEAKISMIYKMYLKLKIIIQSDASTM